MKYLNKRTSSIHLPNKVWLRKAKFLWVVYGMTKSMLEATKDQGILEYLKNDSVNAIIRSRMYIFKTRTGIAIKNIEPELLYTILMQTNGQTEWQNVALQQMQDFMEKHYGDER